MSKEKTGLKSISEGSSDIFKIDPRKLNIKPNWNSRDFADPANIQHINELALSISEVGVKEPLTVYWEDGKAWVSDGECRLRATMQAINVLNTPIKTVPCKAEDRYADEGERQFSQRIRNSGKPFTILEDAKLFKRLLDLGWQQNDIAKKAGISPARVSQILEYNSMPDGIKQNVLAGTVAPTVAMQAVKEHGTQAEKVLKDALTIAKDEGKTKVMGKHVAEASGSETKVNIKTAVKDAFEYSQVDNDSDPDNCIITMPMEHWKKISEMLEL